MKPDILGIRVNFGLQYTEGLMFPTPHLADFLVEKTVNCHTRKI